MNVKNTKATRDIQNVAATMAIENMPLSETFVEELIKVANGEKSSEQLRQEVICKYAKKAIIAWDPDFTKVTPEEREILEKSDSEMKNGEYVTEEDFWKDVISVNDVECKNV